MRTLRVFYSSRCRGDGWCSKDKSSHKSLLTCPEYIFPHLPSQEVIAFYYPLECRCPACSHLQDTFCEWERSMLASGNAAEMPSVDLDGETANILIYSTAALMGRRAWETRAGHFTSPDPGLGSSREYSSQCTRGHLHGLSKTADKAHPDSYNSTSCPSFFLCCDNF